MYKVYGFSKTFNLLNIKRKKLFYQHKLHLNHNSIEKRMISELNTNGIATANIYDFIPENNMIKDFLDYR